MKFLSLSVNGTPIPSPIGIPTGGFETGGNGQSLIQLAISLIFVIGVALAVAFVILSGVQWIISGGDKEKIQKARARLTYSIIGLVVITGAFFIVGTVISLLGGRPFYFLNTRTAQEACANAAVYVDCGSGRFICGTTDKNACLTPIPTP